MPLNSEYSKRICTGEEIHSSCDQPQDFEDCCKLLHLNEATLLENLKTRYHRDRIYTYIANILIALNPYKEIKGLYSDREIEKYGARSLGDLPPHVFAIAEKALRELRISKRSQSIIVSGESGAGKTESTKHLLKYLCYSRTAHGSPIELKIVSSNPILEAFGNAKTSRNNNSSRFGKHMEIFYDSNYNVIGGYLSHCLLEKSRIVSQKTGERNYHVFYMLCTEASKQLRDKIGITKPENYQYLIDYNIRRDANGPTDHHGSSDDNKGLQRLDDALSSVGFADQTKFQLYALVAAILHLGNLKFEESHEDSEGGCQVSTSSAHELTLFSELVGVNCSELRQALVSRVIQTGYGDSKNNVIKVPLSSVQANNARNALAKALYGGVFDHIVSRINQSVPVGPSAHSIAVLDSPGFECFAVNSFEQLCINYSNEKLQNFFNNITFKDELEVYRREGLNVPDIEFSENQDIIDLFETKWNGIFSLIDEESKLPNPCSDHFTSELHNKWSGHNKLSLPRKSCHKAHRTLTAEKGFVVCHFAGPVCYGTEQFIEKNNDALHALLESLMKGSTNALVRAIFGSSKSTPSGSKLTFNSVGSKFKTQVCDLIKKLECNGTNFIRCIKPNTKMLSDSFEDGSVLLQMQFLGLTSVLKLMGNGYPSRVPFADLHSMYKIFLPFEVEPKIFCEAILRSIGLKYGEYKFGVTKVFFPPGKFVEFDRIMRSDPETSNAIATELRKWLTEMRWRKTLSAVFWIIRLKRRILYRRKCILLIQKYIREYLTRKRQQRQLVDDERNIEAKIEFTDHGVNEMVNIVNDVRRSDRIRNTRQINIGNTVKQKTFQCIDCKKMLSNVWNLERHKVRAHSDSSISCRFCLKTFIYSGDLEQHEAIHRSKPHLLKSKKPKTKKKKKKIIICDVCKIVFTKVTSLKRHILKQHNQ